MPSRLRHTVPRDLRIRIAAAVGDDGRSRFVYAPADTAGDRVDAAAADACQDGAQTPAVISRVAGSGSARLLCRGGAWLLAVLSGPALESVFQPYALWPLPCRHRGLTVAAHRTRPRPGFIVGYLFGLVVLMAAIGGIPGHRRRRHRVPGGGRVLCGGGGDH